MRRARLGLRPMAAVVRRDFLLAWSYRAQFVAGLFTGFITMAIFYYISRLVRVGQFSSTEYFAFVAIGIMVLTVLNAMLQLPQVALRQELVAGTFERMLLSPRGPVAAVVSLLVYPALYALLTVLVLICIGGAVFGLPLSWGTVPLGLPLIVLSLVAFSPFGVLMLAGIVLSKKAPPGSSYVVAALSLVAGLYFPVSLLPGWIRWTSEVQPLTPATDLMRWALVGQSLDGPVWLAVGKLALFALLALPASVAVLRLAFSASRRRGTILEY